MSSASVDDPVTVELAPEEAAGGVDKTISLLTGRLVTIRVPAGTVDGALLRLPNADISNPALPKDVILRARVVATPGVVGERPPLPVRPGAAPDAAAPDATDLLVLPPDTSEPPEAPEPRRRRAVALAATAVFLVVAVAAGGIIYYRGQHRAPTPAAAPSPTLRVSPAAYQDLLTTADTQLATAFQGVAAAKTPTDLRTATRALRDTLAAQVTALRVAPGHADLVSALTALETDADHTSAAAASLAVCGSASALPGLTGTPAAGAVRAVAKTLAADGYTFGSFLPAASSAPTRQATTGTYTKKGPRTGQGKLKIINNGAADATISLAPPGTRSATFTVYVRAGATFTVSGIKDGTYQIFQATGVDWDTATGGFTRGCAFQQFDNPTTFKNTGGTYTQWSISLSPAPGTPTSSGQSALSAVDPGQFPT